MPLFMVERTQMSTRTWFVEADDEDAARNSNYMDMYTDAESHFGEPTIEVTLAVGIEND